MMKINVDKLKDLIETGEPVFILDVRPTSERNEWYIPGSHHLDAYKRLNASDFSVLDEITIPPDATIITVCAAGRTSLIAAEELRKKYAEVYSLEGGMKAWNYVWNTAEYLLPETTTRIIQVRRLAKGCLSYVIGSGNEAIVIDASLDPAVYQKIAEENRWIIRYVMDTHIHADYISRTRELAHESKAELIFIESAKVEYPFTPVADHQSLSFGHATLEVLHTPGHTVESTCYLLEGKALLTGDTLFVDGVGRPDLNADIDAARSKAEKLFQSLQMIRTLSGKTEIFPAHFAGSIAFNQPIIKDHLSALEEKLELLNYPKEEFVEAIIQKIPPTPANYELITQMNKRGNHEGVILADIEAGANHCAVS